jgi:hypothetical protein
MRRYRENRRRRRSNTEPRRRSVLMRPGVQVTVLLVVGLVIYILLQNGAR